MTTEPPTPTMDESDIEMADCDDSKDDAEPSNENDEDDDDAAQAGESMDREAALLHALSHKETGNAHFSSQNLIEASRSYRKGISLLKPFNVANTGEDQIKALLVTMNTNLSMVCYKQQKYKLARDAAGKALEMEGTNVKALYRRALAHRSLGDEDAALVDLKAAYKLDETNVAVKKEVASIKKSRELAKQNEKERLQKAFSSKGSLLYGDKEAEEKRAAKRREMEKKEKEEREAKEKEKLKKQWEDDCVEILKNGEEVLSFEQWDERRLQREKEEKERKEKERKEAEKKKREERKAAAAAANKEQDDTDSEDELTEKELAMLRGYKKTSDGRTTSYFTREQTEKEKELIGCIQPKRLESAASNTSSATPSEQLSSQSVGSVWNQSGTTWEEKDTTDWCKSCLKECLLESMAAHATESGNATYIAQVKGVDGLVGDASVALAGGKKRFIYDFHTDVKYEIMNDEKECVASGSLKLPDINSAHTAAEELEVEILRWSKSPVKEDCDASGVDMCRNLLVGEVRKSVLKFVERFNANF
eukprot:scaffold13586_cov82-Cyclotella_meneghiniana.AAC.1